jgi:hypothetical protein
MKPTLFTLLFTCGLAQASSVTLADQLALATSAVRGACPVQVMAGAECATADYSLSTVRSLVDIELFGKLTSPWRQLTPDAVTATTQGQTVTLYSLSAFRTLLTVTAATAPAAQPTAPDADIWMLLGWNEKGDPRAALLARGCTITPAGGNLSRVSCTFPNVGTLYTVVRLP